MPDSRDLFQSADWKQEKHVPVIDIPAVAKKGDFLKITVTVGKEIPHPNKTEHYIAWVSLYFQAQDEKFPYEIAKAEFSSHGASTNGSDTSSVYTHPQANFTFKTDKPGMLYAFSYCNIHGLWQGSKELTVR